MIKFAEATGKTTEAAVAAARQELGISEDEGSVEVLTLPKSGFLGIGAVSARVRVTVELPDPKPEKTGKKHEPPKAAKAPRPAEPETRTEPREVPVYAAGSREEKVNAFLQGLLERMGVQADVIITPREGGGLNAELVGENMGAVIGRRGETLDAIQHLANYALNRGSDKHMHISVDAEQYRSRREESLVHLAEKMAAKALKYKRSMALEPMNSYERHVIHTALQNYEGVTTSSIGTEPNRRVVVSCEGATGERSERRRGGDRDSRQSRERNRSQASQAERAARAPEKTEESAAPVQERETLPPDYPEGYEPPVKNKPTSREWC